MADPFSRLGCQLPNRKSYADSVRLTVYHLAKLDVPRAILWDLLRKESESDTDLSVLKTAFLSYRTLPPDFLRVKLELSVADNMVLRGDRLIPPSSLRHRILRQAHEGYPGIEIMKRRLRTNGWWLGMVKTAEKIVKTCRNCLAVSLSNPPAPLSCTKLPASPWEYVAIDFLGSLPDGRFIFVIIDYFSRFMVYVFTKLTSSQSATKALFRSFARFGFPSQLKSDNAKTFTSDEFKEFMADYGLEHIRHPRYGHRPMVKSSAKIDQSSNV